MIVAADTSPLNYLVLIGRADLPGVLFELVVIPPAVEKELRHPKALDSVRAWIATPRSWLKVLQLETEPDPALDYLDEGEREAITLAEEIHADRLLVDERPARREAARRNISFSCLFVT